MVLDSIELNKLILKSVGLWPEKKYQINTYALFAFCLNAIFLILNILMQLIHLIEMIISGNIEQIIEAVYFVIGECGIILKVSCLALNTSKLQQLTLKLTKHDLFQAKNSKQVKILKKNYDSWSYCCNIYMSVMIVYLFIQIFHSLFGGGFESKGFLYTTWFPYRSTETPFYEIYYFYEVISIAFMLTSEINVDLFFLLMLVHIGAQCDLLCDNLKYNICDFNQKENRINKINEEENHKLRHPKAEEKPKNLMYQKLIRCIRHHKEILR